MEVQILAASNRNLQTMVSEGHFRGDLYHRLSVFSLQLPSLRESIEDLEDLVPLFVAEFNARANRQVRIIPEDAWRALRAYHWPGNVRELRNVIERCVLFAEGPVFPSHWLQLPGAPTAVVHEPATRSSEERLLIPLDGSMALDDMDCHIIQTTLSRCHGNVTAAARALGTTRETLRYRIRKYGLKETV